MFRILFLSATLFAGLLAKSQAADLTVLVTDVAPASGQLLVSVFGQQEAWMKAPVASQNLTVAADGTSFGTFKLPVGSYAVALIHDANGNGQMDTNALGIPTEAFGFSNDARARFGPPAFTKAAFQLTESGQRLTISLNRAKH